MKNIQNRHYEFIGRNNKLIKLNKGERMKISNEFKKYIG